jgi:hypothetical protein
MSWDAFLSLGDAYARGSLLCARGFDAAWAFLFSEETTAWMRGCASPRELDKIALEWGDVWWRYLCARVGAPSDGLTSVEAACVVHLGCEALRTSARARSVFLAVMFQIVVSERHDQMLCSIRGDPAHPPFYADYVSRSKVGSTFSLRSLLRCEGQYACAKRTVDRFRGVKGRVVAEVYAPGGAELIRLGRTKLKRFLCARCSAKRPRPGCKRCTRLQERNPGGIVSYFGHHRTYTPAEDVQTVCGDAVFVAVEHLKEGDVVLSHTKTGSRRLRVTAVARADGNTVAFHLCDAASGAELRWQRAVKSVVPVLPCRPDATEMMRERPDVVHGMGMSVHPDKISEKWTREETTGVPATTPLRLTSLKGKHLTEYAMWRSLAAFVQHLLPEHTPKRVKDAIRTADTHCLHHENQTFTQR